MNALKWWFRLVGGFYVFLGLGFIPAINELRLPMMLAEIDAPIGGHIYHALLDFTFMFGLDMIVIGAYMLYASRAPNRHFSIVWLVIALEIVRGILDDIYMIFQGYAPLFYLAFILVHLIIIFTGVLSVRKAQIETNAGDGV